MSKYLLLLITLLSWLVPTPIRAETKKEAPLVFIANESLTKGRTDVYRPSLSEVSNPQPKPKAQTKAKRVTQVRNVSYGYCSCVTYVKNKIGYTKSVGAARNFPINSHVPTPGSVVVTLESRIGHVAIVDHADEEYVYLQSEANYSHCRITYGRRIPVNSKIIKGYYEI